MKTTFAFIVSLACIFTTSCRNSELTRARAKNILDKVGADSPTMQSTLSLDQVKKAGQVKDPNDSLAKVFIVGKDKLCLPDPNDVRIATGQFVLCPPGLDSGITWERPGVIFRMKQPIKWGIVEITGITGGQTQNDRIVEYTWQLDFASLSLPREIEDSLKLPVRSGKALLRLYDDGWRFVQFM